MGNDKYDGIPTGCYNLIVRLVSRVCRWHENRVEGAPVREMYINEYGERRALLSLAEAPEVDEGATDATAEILIINSIPFVTRSIYFGAQRSFASALGSARF